MYLSKPVSQRFRPWACLFQQVQRRLVPSRQQSSRFRERHALTFLADEDRQAPKDLALALQLSDARCIYRHLGETDPHVLFQQKAILHLQLLYRYMGLTEMPAILYINFFARIHNLC